MTEFTVDSREPFSYKIEALEFGDCQFRVNGKLVRIERKTWDDLLNSLASGRLAIQLNNLKADNAYPFLMIVGNPTKPLDRRTKRNILLSIKLCGILVESIDNLEDYNSRIKELHDFLDTDNHTSLIPYRYSDPKLGAIMWVSGIGFKRAKALLELYQGDLASIYMSDIPALSKVLGSKLAYEFYHAVRKYPKTVKASKEDYDLYR